MRKRIGIAVHATQPALDFAAIIQAFEQLANLRQKDFRLLRRCLGFQPDAGHHQRPLASPTGELGRGRLKSKLGRYSLSLGRGELGFQVRPSLRQVIVSLEQCFGLLQHFAEIRVHPYERLVPASSKAWSSAGRWALKARSSGSML